MAEEHLADLGSRTDKLKAAGNPTDGRKALNSALDAAGKVKDSGTKSQLNSEINAALKV